MGSMSAIFRSSPLKRSKSGAPASGGASSGGGSRGGGGGAPWTVVGEEAQKRIRTVLYSHMRRPSSFLLKHGGRTLGNAESPVCNYNHKATINRASVRFASFLAHFLPERGPPADRSALYPVLPYLTRWPWYEKGYLSSYLRFHRMGCMVAIQGRPYYKEAKIQYYNGLWTTPTIAGSSLVASRLGRQGLNRPSYDGLQVSNDPLCEGLLTTTAAVGVKYLPVLIYPPQGNPCNTLPPSERRDNWGVGTVHGRTLTYLLRFQYLGNLGDISIFFRVLNRSLHL